MFDLGENRTSCLTAEAQSTVLQWFSIRTHSGSLGPCATTHCKSAIWHELQGGLGDAADAVPTSPVKSNPIKAVLRIILVSPFDLNSEAEAFIAAAKASCGMAVPFQPSSELHPMFFRPSTPRRTKHLHCRSTDGHLLFAGGLRSSFGSCWGCSRRFVCRISSLGWAFLARFAVRLISRL